MSSPSIPENSKDPKHHNQSTSKSKADYPSKGSPVSSGGQLSGVAGPKEPSNSTIHGSSPDSTHNHSCLRQNSLPNTNAKIAKDKDPLVANPVNHIAAISPSLPSTSDLLQTAESTVHSNGQNATAKPTWNFSNSTMQQSSSSAYVNDSCNASPNGSGQEVLHIEDEALHISALPENVLENLLTFLDLSDVRSSSVVCAEWYRVISDENGEVWRSHCIRRMSRDVLHSELLSTCPTYKAKLRAYFHSWNPQDCSRNVYVKPNGFTIHRNPVAQSTDGARSKIGFNKGRHAWEVIWEGPLGTVAVVGVATQQAEMRAQGYIALLGKDDQSWGWNLVENVLLHNGDSQGHYPLINNAPRYQVGERIRVILDCEDNTLSFEKNFEFLGVAFRGLPKRELLYPAVSAVYGNTEISMVYLGPPMDG